LQANDTYFSCLKSYFILFQHALVYLLSTVHCILEPKSNKKRCVQIMNFANPDYTDTYSYILVHTCTYSYILVHTVIQCHLIRISLELSCYDVNNRTFSPGLVLFLRCFYGIYCDKLACTCYISSYTRIY
jgi:hypothetical protein